MWSRTRSDPKPSNSSMTSRRTETLIERHLSSYLTFRHSYLLTYASFQFHAYLETLIASNTTTPAGGTKQDQSPWMLTHAANIIFGVAECRSYTISSTSKRVVPRVIDLVDDEGAWDALNEAEGRVGGKGKEKDQKPTWVPDGMDPILKELPKWKLLSAIILEVEEIIMPQTITRKPAIFGLASSFVVSSAAYHDTSHTGSNTILVMDSSTKTCSLFAEFLSTMNRDVPIAQWNKRPANDGAKSPVLSLVEIPALGYKARSQDAIRYA